MTGARKNLQRVSYWIHYTKKKKKKREVLIISRCFDQVTTALQWQAKHWYIAL